MLEIRGLSTRYGNIHALKGVDLGVAEGGIACILGANGAGKTTLMKTVCGLLRPAGGTIRFQGKDITGLAPEAIVRRGIVLVPEGRAILSRMTVLENLEMGAYIHNDRARIQQDLEEVLTRFPRLRERRKQLGGTLSGGEQQMLAIGRAMMSRPTLLLLDEPSMGLSPILVEQIFEIIRDINNNGVSILLVEQNAQMALSIADRGYVLETGGVVQEGPAQDLLHDPAVMEAYLGGHS